MSWHVSKEFQIKDWLNYGFHEGIILIYNLDLKSTFVERNVCLVQFQFCGPMFEFEFGPIKGLHA